MTFVPGPLTYPPPHPRVYFQALGLFFFFFRSEDDFLIPGDASGDGSEMFQLYPPRERPDGWQTDGPDSWLDGEKRDANEMCAALSCVSSPLPGTPFFLDSAGVISV